MSETLNTHGLIDGPITSGTVAQYVEALSQEVHSGAIAQFLGQVRADDIEGQSVAGIEYSAYAGMAEKEIAAIRTEGLAKFDLNSAYLFHSIGKVKVGELSLMIILSSGHSKTVYEPLNWFVDQVKARIPIWKKEWFADGETRWVEGKGMGQVDQKSS